MALSKIVLVLLAAAVIVPLNAGDTSWTRGGDAPQPLSIDLAAVKPTFTQCEEVVVRVYNPGPGDVGFSEPPMLHIFTASGDPVTNPYSDLTVVWTLPAGDSEDFTWDQTYDLVVAGIPDARNGDPVPLGDYYAVFGLADMNGNLPGPAPFSIVPCLSVDAGADQSIDEGESVDLSLQVNLDANSTLLSVSWDLDAAADADGNGNATDDADLVGQSVTAVFGDDGEFDVTANARVSTNSTNVSKVDQDVLFLIDSSGSMQWNDPSNLRLTASKAYVDQLTPDDRAAVIDFDTEAFLVPQPDHINPGDHLSMNYAKVKQNIDLVDSFGGTEFRDAFRLMNKEFSTRGDPTHVWVGIFLTDAQSISINDMLRFPQTLNETVKLGIRVFPVGLSVPEELHGFTMNIANVTGGQYFPSPSPEDLEEVYANISSAVESGGEAIQVLTDTLHVSVGNVAPSLAVDVESISGGGNLTLRVAGEKFHDVTATLYRDDVPVETVSIVRVPGSPNEQAVSFSTAVEPGATYRAEVLYTPLDDPVNGQVWGATPAWLLLDNNGTEVRLHHTFNVRHPDTWVWTVDDLGSLLPASGVTLTAAVTDPGSDDLTLLVDWGDGAIETQVFLNNASVGSDPDPSIEVNPRAVTFTATHAYAVAGTYTVNVTVADDDGGLATAVVTVTV